MKPKKAKVKKKNKEKIVKEIMLLYNIKNINIVKTKTGKKIIKINK